MRDYVDRDTAASEASIERNTQDIRRVSLRQQNVEERINALNQSNEGKTSPVKFLEELKDFWAAIRPSRGQAASIISSCLQGTPRDWWDLVNEDSCS